MPDPRIRSDRPKAPTRHRIANVQDELAGNLAKPIRGRHLRPRCVSEFHRQRTHRTTHTQSVDARTGGRAQRHG